MRGERPETHEGEPQCGWFRTRLVKNGPFVSARIWCEQEIDPETGELCCDEVLRCEVGGERRNPARAWTFLTAIPIEDYEALVEARRREISLRADMVPFAFDATNRRILRP